LIFDICESIQNPKRLKRLLRPTKSTAFVGR